MSKDNTPSITTNLNYILKSHACTQVNFDKYSQEDYPKMVSAIQSLILQCLPEKNKIKGLCDMGRTDWTYSVAEAISHNKAIDTITTQLREKGLIE